MIEKISDRLIEKEKFMKSFDRIYIAVFFILVCILIAVNIFLFRMPDNTIRSYRVEAERAAHKISENGMESLDLSDFPAIRKVTELNASDSQKTEKVIEFNVLDSQKTEKIEIEKEKIEKAEIDFFEGDNSDYLIKNINGKYYRFDYLTSNYSYQKKFIIFINVILIFMSVFLIAVFQFLRVRLLKPFFLLREVPFELSKGNLTIPLKENKNRFFGRFIWGIDLLRENLEQYKTAELNLQKEKKTLILSISHDIKTPLSAIKLYAKALEKNLYNSPEKQKEITGKINAKADEIESFVSQVISACNEDFLKLSVKKGEFYLSQAIGQILEYYTEKLDLLRTDFKVEDYRDCILEGDLDRVVEVMQNIMENAVKYGDGHSVCISFASEEDCQLITVKNTGCTLSDAELPHIFESFWRGSNAVKSSGSGLGLYICRQLMNKMGGEVFAECRAGEMRVTIVLLRA